MTEQKASHLRAVSGLLGAASPALNLHFNAMLHSIKSGPKDSDYRCFKCYCANVKFIAKRVKKSKKSCQSTRPYTEDHRAERRGLVKCKLCDSVVSKVTFRAREKPIILGKETQDRECAQISKKAVEVDINRSSKKKKKKKNKDASAGLIIPASIMAKKQALLPASVAAPRHPTQKAKLLSMLSASQKDDLAGGHSNKLEKLFDRKK